LADDTSDVDPMTPVAYAPPASAMDAPTAPTTGAVVGLLVRFFFIRTMSDLQCLRNQPGLVSSSIRTPIPRNAQGDVWLLLLWQPEFRVALIVLRPGFETPG
jgi:hypothetical protein